MIDSQLEQSPVQSTSSPEVVPTFCTSDMGISLLDVEGGLDDSFFDELMSGSAKEDGDIEDSYVNETGQQKTLQQNMEKEVDHTFFDDLTSSTTGRDNNIETSCVYMKQSNQKLSNKTQKENSTILFSKT
ncbi:uncharacterized protein EAF01_007709 [Botrytis porri]|uniref:uncharacterized protein n=1 Tax=Botrytis porri TaxID=87229 RepID=UPI001902477A|nr:uncharacterized protein EAF01_007709 [Botrytis porri]KAF7900407.1 hypothetical protein EAF01_007709 [Botrytis porri]